MYPFTASLRLIVHYFIWLSTCLFDTDRLYWPSTCLLKSRGAVLAEYLFTEVRGLYFPSTCLLKSRGAVLAEYLFAEVRGLY